MQIIDAKNCRLSGISIIEPFSVVFESVGIYIFGWNFEHFLEIPKASGVKTQNEFSGLNFLF